MSAAYRARLSAVIDEIVDSCPDEIARDRAHRALSRLLIADLPAVAIVPAITAVMATEVDTYAGVLLARARNAVIGGSVTTPAHYDAPSDKENHQ